jgi:hypothetical protein
VPDVFQILVKEKGVFTNVTSPTTKAKLRILFEVAPIGLMVENAGGEHLAMGCALLCVCVCVCACAVPALLWRVCGRRMLAVSTRILLSVCVPVVDGWRAVQGV